MATDTTNFTPETTAVDHHVEFDAVQLAQASAAGTPVQVQIPQGQKVVRIPVTAGETIILPFDAEAVLAGKLGDNGNLAIKVGDVTVILEGYTAAEGQQPVIIETTDGSPIVLADVLAAGKDLDIQTAAGGDAAGAQGADNTGAILSAFAAGNGIGGFGAIGAQVATELQYRLIDAERKLFLVEREDVDTHPTATNTPGEVDEDGRHHLKENPFDDCYGGINTDPAQPGDEDRSYKISVKIVDYGPDGPAAVNPLVGDAGDGICRDTDGNLVYSHGQQVLLQWNPSENRLEGYVESDPCQCGEVPVEFQKYPTDTVSYDEGKGCYIRLVFTATVENGGADGTVCFKLLGPLDHPFNTDPDAQTPVYTATLADAEGDGTQGDGCCDPYAKWTEFEDNIKLDLLFQAKDGDDSSYTPIPFVVDVDDDSPAFLDCDFDPSVGYTLVNDETHGVQCGTDDVSVTQCFLNALFSEQVEPGESTIYDRFVQFFGCEALQSIEKCDVTAAETKLKFGYGADGPLVHEICCDGGDGNTGGDNTQLRTEGLQVDGGLVNPYDVAHGGDCVINCGALLTNSCGDVNFCEDTGLTITIGDCESTTTAHVWMEGIGNTIFGYAYAPQDEFPSLAGFEGEGQYGNKIPVFIITIDPDTKELTYVQLHQINHDNPWDPNEANDGGEGSCHVLEQINIGLAITDYDHDSIWTQVHITVLDDGPKLKCVEYVSQTDGSCEAENVYSTDKGNVDEDWLKHGNRDYDGGSGAHGDDFGSTHVEGRVKVDFGADQPGSFSFKSLTVTDDQGCVLFDHCTSNLFTSKGEPVEVDFCNPGEVSGYACGNLVFTLTIDCDGNFCFTQYQALQHPFIDSDFTNDGNPESNWEDNLHFSFEVKATDCDGDSLCTSINIDVDDDAPAICEVTYFSEDTGYQESEIDARLTQGGGTFESNEHGSLDEDFLKGGNHDYDTDPDNLNSPIGDGNNGDGPGGLCVTGQIHAKVGADRPGEFTFDVPGLCESGDHVVSNITSAEGYPITLTLCQEGCNWVIKGTYVDGVAEGDDTVEAFIVTLDSKTGCFTFHLEAPLGHPDSDGNPENNSEDCCVASYEDDLLLSFGVKLTDSDGDYAKTCLEFVVDDDAPVQCRPIDWTVDEDAHHIPGNWEPGAGLPGGIEGGPGDSGTDWIGFTANLNVNFGADGPKEGNPYEFAGVEGDPVTGRDSSGNPIGALTSHGVAIVYHWDEATSTLSGVAGGATVFTAHVDQSNGDLTFQLTGPIDHPDTNDDNSDDATDDGKSSWEDEVSIDLAFNACDQDGDAVVAIATVRIDDDSPSLGCVTVDGSEGESKEALAAVPEQEACAIIHVDEDASLDPANRAPGIEGGPGDDGVGGSVVTGHIAFAYGADGPGSFGFDPSEQPDYLKSHGESVLFKSDGAGGLIAYIATGDETIFTLTVNEGGDFTFTLVRPLDHPGQDDPYTEGKETSYEDNLGFKLVYTVQDYDGDAVKGSLVIDIDDDSPTACQVQAECIDEIFPTHEVSIVAGQPLPAGVTLTAEDQNIANGNTSTVETSSRGIGVNTSPDDGSNPDSDGGPSATPDHNRFDEINYTGALSVDTPGNNSEHLFVNLDGQQLATHATVNLTVFYTGEGGVGTEQGAYRTWKDGVAGDWVVFQAENSGGTKTLNIDDNNGFDRIEFVALPGTTDPSGNQGGDSSDYSIGSIVLTVQDKLHTVGDFCADYGADGPGAVALVLPVLPKGEELTSDGSLITLALSDDSHKLTGTIDTLDGPVTVFELSIDPDTGKYCFDLYRPIDGKGAEDLHIPVDFTVTDFDGDSVTGSITLCVDPDDVPTIEIVPGERVPVLEGGVMLVDEDAIVGVLGNPGGVGDDAGSHITGGTVVYDFGGDGPGSFGFDTSKVFDNADTGLTDYAGHKILMDYGIVAPGVEGVVGLADLDNSGAIEAGENVNGNKFFALVMNDATGQFVFDLGKPVNHPVSGTEDNLPLSFGVKVTDSNGDAATADIKISIDDDTPEAVQDSKTLSAQGVDTNLMIVLDISGSMGDPSGLTALTRLAAAKAAINELFEQYDNLGNVMVRIVTFSTNAAEQGAVWTDLATAHTILNSLSPTSTTNYDAALAAAVGAFPDAGKIVGGQNVSYFISDGKPNAPSGSEGISAAEQTAWETFVSTNHIVSHAIGIGTGLSATELDPIAYNGVTNSQIPSIIVTDLNNLNAALVGTLSGIVVNGDLDGAPSKFGADGGFVKSVTVDGVTHDFNRAANSVTNTGGGTSYDGVSHVLTIHTLLDGVLAINLLDGSYNYTRSSDPSDSGVENIGYVLTDNDGDTAPGSLTVNVSAIDLPPIARDDHISTNGALGLQVSDAALLWNDSDANHDPLSVGAVFNAAGGLAVLHAAGSTTVTDNFVSFGGSFDYSASDGSAPTDTGHVTVDANIFTFDLSGDGLDNILIDAGPLGGTLRGFEGKDVLVGDAGDNTLIGGRNDDLIDLSVGGNDIVRIESKLDGNDVVIGFSTGNAPSHDQVNLDALFDGYGAMSGTRGDHVTVTQVGADTHVNVDLDNNTGNGFEMTISLQSVTAANVTVGNAANDEVILGS